MHIGNISLFIGKLELSLSITGAIYFANAVIFENGIDE